MENKNNNFITILVANFFFFLNFSQLMLLPKFVVHLGRGASDIGMVMGVFSVTVLVVLPVVGVVSDKISRKYLFVAGTTLMCGATLAFAAISSMGPLVYILRILQGTGFACAFGITGAMVFDVTETKRRKRYLGILTAANISTHALGPAFGELMIQHFDYGVFFISAAVFGLFALTAGLMLPQTLRANEPPSSGKSSKKRILPLALASALLGTVFGTAVIFMPPYLLEKNIINSTPFFAGFVLGSLAVWAFLFRIFSSMSESMAWILSAVLLGSVPAAALWINDPATLALVSVMFGIGYGYLYPSMNALVLESLPEKRGFANMIFVWSFNLGMLFASIAGGIISSAMGYGRTFILTAALPLVIVLLRPRRPVPR